MAKPLPKQNSLEKSTHTSPFLSSKRVLIEVAEFSTPHEYDSEDLLHC
jgi:hypothetical protein